MWVERVHEFAPGTVGVPQVWIEGDTIQFLRSTPGDSVFRVYRVPMSGGAVREIAELPPRCDPLPFQTSGDGTRMTCNIPAPVWDIWVAENFDPWAGR